MYSTRIEQQVMNTTYVHIQAHTLTSAVITVMGSLHGLIPSLFTATTCTEYTVNGVRPSAYVYSSVALVIDVLVVVGSDVFPLSSSTTCHVMW